MSIIASGVPPPRYCVRGLGRFTEPDLTMRAPRLHRWSRSSLHQDGRAVTVSWCRDLTQGLHSVAVEYAPNAVRIGLRMGTRPGFLDVAGLVVLNVVVEHTVVQLCEPLGGRRLEVLH